MIRRIGRQHCKLLFFSPLFKCYSNQTRINKLKLPTNKKWVTTNNEHHLMMDGLLCQKLVFGIKD